MELDHHIPLEENISGDYTLLQQYYLTNPDITGNDKLNAVAVNLANWCNIKMQDYVSAIQYYNDILTNPPSYHDSVFALFDLDYINFLMNNSGYKSSVNINSLVYNVSDREKQDNYTDYLAGLLFPQRKLSDQMKQNIESLGAGKLVQNFPNPFNNQTEIWFKLDIPAKVTLNIYNYSGKLISSINEGEVTGGNHNVVYSNKDLLPGLYFYTLVTDGIISDTKKMTVLK